MKVEDIKDGMVIETNNGGRYVKIKHGFIRNAGWLREVDVAFGDGDYDICKVFNPVVFEIFPTLNGENHDLVWEKPMQKNFEWLQENIGNMSVSDFMEFMSCENRPCSNESCDSCKFEWLNSGH